MANPILTDQAFEKATASASGADAALPPPAPGTQAGPISDGPISPYRAYRPMTLDGTIAVTGILFVLLLAAAIWGWNQVEVTDGGCTPDATGTVIGELPSGSCRQIPEGTRAVRTKQAPTLPPNETSPVSATIVKVLLFAAASELMPAVNVTRLSTPDAASRSKLTLAPSSTGPLNVAVLPP